MENLYFFSDSLLEYWENDLMVQQQEIVPSRDVIDAIMDYALSVELYSHTLDKNIAISIN